MSRDRVVKYHPTRFASARPHLNSLVYTYRELAGRDMPTMSALQAVQAELSRRYNDSISLLNVDQRPTDTAILTREVSLTMHYAAFAVHGRNIFNFADAMVGLFRHTDIDDVPLSALKFPYGCFYIAFGPQKDLDLWGQGYLVDGAYVSNWHGRIDVLLTTYGAHAFGSKGDEPLWITRPERYYYFSVPADDESRSLAQAINAHLAEAQPFSPKYFPEITGHYAVNEQQVTIIDTHRQTAERVARENAEGFPTFRQALRLVVNGLCYLSAYPDDIDTRYPPETPPAMLEKLRRAAKPKERQRTSSKLASMGYSKIHFAGNRLRAETTSALHGSASPHWRRGHWRHQPVGHKRSDRRLIWIMPAIVRRDKGDPEIGHVYLVDSDEQQSG